MVVRDIILAVAVLGVMVFGFFVMKRLDKFLDENRKRIEQEEKEKEPSCVMLTTDMTDEELIKNIRTYEKQRGDAYITLYQDKDELYDELFDGKRLIFSQIYGIIIKTTLTEGGRAYEKNEYERAYSRVPFLSPVKCENHRNGS